MQIAVLSSAIFAYSFVLMLFWRRVRNADHLAGRIETVVKLGMANNADANELNQPFMERFLRPKLQRVAKWLEGLMSKQEDPKLANALRMAGKKEKPSEYNAKRLIANFMGWIVATIFGLMIRNGWVAILLVNLVVTIVLLILMHYLLISSIRKRKQAIQKQLPEVLDLLSVSVEAGLGFDAALQRISNRASGALIDEFTAVYREITLGRPRAEALRNFEQRCGLEEIKTFVSSIIQAEQLGISLKNVLKSQAQQMRLLKRQRVEEKAMKAPVKIILPLVMFVFPVLFIILLAPAIISIIGMRGMFGG